MSDGRIPRQVTLDGLRVHVGPNPLDRATESLLALGASMVDTEHAEVLIWTSMSRKRLSQAMHPGIRFVQLPIAGVERWVEDTELMNSAAFASAAGIYGPLVAEHALALLLAGFRDIHRFARSESWEDGAGLRTGALRGATVTIIGAGGIGSALIRMLAPLGVNTIAVTRTGRSVPAAQRSVGFGGLDDLWAESDAVVLAAPATVSTERLIDARTLELMRSDAWLVNVARGTLIDTNALVAALRSGHIGGAALDVTEPEPLPADHPLWTEPRCLITPHTGLPDGERLQLLAEHAVANTVRFAQGEPLQSLIDAARGY
jgi:phosphoglycerate dehydrogenase-like enzyme